MIGKTIIIDGRPVELAWNQGTSRRFQFRAAKHAVRLDLKALTDPLRAHAAFIELLWLMLPDGEFQKHASAEDLAVVIDAKKQVGDIVAVVSAAIAEMMASDQKKTNGASTPSPASNSASRLKSGTPCTRKSAKQSPKHGGKKKSG